MNEKELEQLINRIKSKIVGQPVDMVVAALSYILVHVAINSGYNMDDVIEFLRETEENQQEYRRIQ